MLDKLMQLRIDWHYSYIKRGSTVLFVEMLVPPYEMFDGKEGLGIMGGRETVVG